MERINDDFYVGFEGEPEIQFIYKSVGRINKTIIWEGYFDELMRAVKPDVEGWTSLAYYYNMYTGWYDENPWKVEKPNEALAQLESIDVTKLKEETRKVLQTICFDLKEGIENNMEIYIERD